MTAFGTLGAETYAERLASLQAQLAANPTNTTLLLRLGDLCHDEGVKDNREAVKLAEQYFKKLLALEETNAFGRALYGSTLTMKGRDAFWPPTRLRYVHDGIKEMDAAVALAPDDPKVRFTRANNNFYMPKWLGREEIVQTDLAWLWGKIQAKPGTIETPIEQQVALMHGIILKRQQKLPEALKVWRQGLEFDPESETAKEIKDQVGRVTPPAKK
jgi:tetratricopeptide (TPR) repeat protein